MPRSIRLFVSCPLAPGAAPKFDCAQAHYLARVMRRRAGEEILLFNGRDGVWQARITALGPAGGQAALGRLLISQMPEPGPWLAFALLKRAANELLVQKATELGVARLLPFRAERSTAANPNLARLAAIATEAAEQSERLTRPEITPAASLPKLIGAWPSERPLLAAIARQASPPPAGGATTGLLIGPEGGFTKGELDLLAHTPFVRPVSLGPRILRAETAAIVGLALLVASAGNPI